MHVSARPRPPGYPGATSLMRFCTFSLQRTHLLALGACAAGFTLCLPLRCSVLSLPFVLLCPLKTFFTIVGHPLAAALPSAAAINFWPWVLLPSAPLPRAVLVFCAVCSYSTAQSTAQKYLDRLMFCANLVVVLFFIFPPFFLPPVCSRNGIRKGDTCLYPSHHRA